MSQTDSEFVNALRFGAILIESRITPFVNGQPLGDVLYATVSTGTFTIDRNSNQRRSGSLTLEVIPSIPPPALLPTSPSSILAPFGNELLIETGITSSVPGSAGMKSSTTWTSAGLYAIATSTVDDTTLDAIVTLNLYDRSWTIAQRTLKNPYNFPSTPGGNFVEEIETLLNKVWEQDPSAGPLLYNIVPTDQVIPQTSYDQGSDPWQACLDLAEAIGYELYFNANGEVIGRPTPDPFSLATTWNFTDDPTEIVGLAGTGSTALFGSPYSTPVEVSIQMTRDGIPNDIVVQGTGDANAATYSGDGLETSDPPVLAEAYDNNPLSPTYVGGGMGDVPSFVESALVTSTGAQAYADNELQIALSASWTVTISSPPNPLFDVDQVCTVTRPRVGMYKVKMILDTITQVISYDDEVQLTGRVLAQSFYTPGSFT